MLSIIIPTRNESSHIVACVEAVHWALSAGLAEIIVVDNSSDDDTEALAIMRVLVS